MVVRRMASLPSRNGLHDGARLAAASSPRAASGGHRTRGAGALAGGRWPVCRPVRPRCAPPCAPDRVAAPRARVSCRLYRRPSATYGLWGGTAHPTIRPERVTHDPGDDPRAPGPAPAARPPPGLRGLERRGRVGDQRGALPPERVGRPADREPRSGGVLPLRPAAARSCASCRGRSTGRSSGRRLEFTLCTRREPRRHRRGGDRAAPPVEDLLPGRARLREGARGGARGHPRRAPGGGPAHPARAADGVRDRPRAGRGPRRPPDPVRGADRHRRRALLDGARDGAGDGQPLGQRARTTSRPWRTRAPRWRWSSA